jgi:hypothetical protein
MADAGTREQATTNPFYSLKGSIMANAPLRRTRTGVTWPARAAPLLLDHDRTIRSQVGSASGWRVEGSELLAELHFASSDLADDAGRLIEEGHAGSVSVGYRRIEVRTLAPGKVLTVGSKMFTAPLDRSMQVVTRWEVKEVSLVPIPADVTAGVRCAIVSSVRKVSMPATLTEVISSRDLAHMSVVEYLRTGMSRRNERIPENDPGIVRAALSSVSGVADLTNLLTVSVLTGYRGQPDSTQGWVQVVSLPNYLAAYIAKPDALPRVERHARGGTASHVNMSFASPESWKLARFASQFVMDEQDVLDAGEVGIFQVALEEIGRSARRLVADLAFSVILQNPTLARDSVALFHSTHANTGTGALATTTLGTAIAAIGNQVAEDEQGNPVHLGLSPRYLVIPPALYQTALNVLDDSILDKMAVRADSRLGTVGLLDPRDGETTRTGTATNWMIACPSEQAAGVVVGALDGNTEPAVREFRLDQGQWGIGVDITLSLAVAAADYRPLYWSTGV